MSNEESINKKKPSLMTKRYLNLGMNVREPGGQSLITMLTLNQTLFILTSLFTKFIGSNALIARNCYLLNVWHN